MTNQQGAPEALTDPSPDQLRAIARTARNSSGSASDDCGPLAYVLHGWRAAAIAFRAQQAALVDAQQPAPSAAAAGVVRWAAGIEGSHIEVRWTDGEPPPVGTKIYTQPFTTPQADSQPAPQGETNAQLDTDSNPTTPGQQRNMAGPVAVGQPVGHRSDQATGDPQAQRDKLLTVAERNIRSFLRIAVFKSESDREAALNCVDVLWHAASAPADSVTAPAAATNTKTAELLSTTVGLLMGYREGGARQPYRPGSLIAKTVDEVVEHLKDWPYPEPTPPAQAADSVLEDAARLKVAVDLLEELAEHDSYSTEYDGRMVSICPECGEQEGEHRPNCAFVRAKAYLAARKQGGSHD